MITVLIENLEFETIIGLLDFERTKKQKVVVNAKFEALEFVDYALVCEEIEDEFNKQKFLKVEDALIFFKDKFKKKYKTLNYFYMKIIKKEIIKNSLVGAQIEEKF